MIDDALRVFRIEEYSQFRNFDDALDELTRKLYEGEYYNTPDSFVSISYNLELHGFQTFASSSSIASARVSYRSGQSAASAAQ